MKSSFVDSLYYLARSITIKSSHQADLINNNIVSTYGTNYVNIDRPETWRYYMNLAGVPHFSNQTMVVNTIEDNIERTLTKDMLDTYPLTRLTLMEYSTILDALIKKYPTEETLIRGMIAPTEYDIAISAKDGTILNYSEMYVESNETEVMRRLSTYSSNLYIRWMNPLYLETDPLALSLFLAFLYSTYPIKIDIMRFENIHTHKVHSHHLENFFKSNLDVDTTYMNFKSKMWLYQNLRTVMTNNGKEETLTEIMDNVLTENGVGVGNLTVRRNRPVEVTKNISYHDAKIIDYVDDNKLVFNPMNKYYEGKTITLPQLLSTEIENDYIHKTAYNRLDELVDRIDGDVSENTDLRVNSKVLHMIGREERDLLPFPRVNVILDNYFHIYTHTDTDYLLNFVDTNTNKLYKLTFKKAIKLLAYLLAKLSGIGGNTIHLISHSVVSPAIDDGYRPLLMDDDTGYEYITTLNSIRPSHDTTYTTKDNTTDYINEVLNYFVVEWAVRSDLRNQMSVANLQLMGRANHYGSMEIDFSDIVDSIEFVVSDDGYDYISAMEELVSTLSNGRLPLDINEVNRESIRSYADLVKKTTSYHLQIIIDGRNNEKVHIFDVGPGLNSTTPIIELKGSYLNGFGNIGSLIMNPISLVNIMERHGGGGYLEPELTDNNGTAVIPDLMMPIKELNLMSNSFDMVYSSRIAGANHMLESSLTDNNGLATNTLLATMPKNHRLMSKSISSVYNLKYTDNEYRLEPELTDMNGTAISGDRETMKAPAHSVSYSELELSTGVGTITNKTIDEDI